MKRLPAWMLGATACVRAFFPLPAAAWSEPEVHGNIRLGYVTERSGGGEEDQLTQSIRLDARKLYWSGLALNLEARNRFSYGKTSLGQETRDDLRLSLAYATLESSSLSTALMLGRQYFYAGESVAHFDGAAAEWRPARWFQAGGFAGRPAEEMLGGGRLAEGYEGGSVRLGSGRKGYLQGGMILASHGGRYPVDRDLQLTAFRRLTDLCDVRASASALNGEPKTASVRAQYRFLNRGLTLSGNYFKQLYVADPASLALSPYARASAQTERFERRGLQFSQVFAGRFSLSGSGEYHLPARRWQFSGSLAGSSILLRGVDAGLSATHSSQAGRTNLTFSGYAGYRINGTFQVNTGTSYNAARDPGLGGYGNSTSRTYFADLRWTAEKGREVRLAPSMVRASGAPAPIYQVELTNNWRF